MSGISVRQATACTTINIIARYTGYKKIDGTLKLIDAQWCPMLRRERGPTNRYSTYKYIRRHRKEVRLLPNNRVEVEQELLRGQLRSKGSNLLKSDFDFVIRDGPSPSRVHLIDDPLDTNVS